MKSAQVVIAGAGISGLVAAIELEKQGIQPTIIESRDIVGGRLSTAMHKGLPLDKGFQVLLTPYPAARRYLDMESLELRKFTPGAAIFRNGTYHRFGDFMRDPSLMWSTISSHAGSLADKWKTYRLSLKLKSKSIERIFQEPEISSLEYLQRQGFSDKMIQTFFKPFYGGIFLDRDLKTSSRMFEFTFKMFAEGHAAIPGSGMQEIVLQLAGKLKKTKLRLNTSIESVQEQTAYLSNGDTLDFDVLIDSTGLFSHTEPEAWHACKTHYFRTQNNPLNEPIIALISDPDAPFNTFHYVSDLVADSSSGHCLSVTCVGGQIDFDIDTISQYLMNNCGIRVEGHLRTEHIARALPVLKSLSYTNLDPEPVEGVIACGDLTSNASINGAMESGAAAASRAISLLSTI